MGHTDPPPHGVSPGGHGTLDNPEVAHEHSDVNVRALLASAVGLIVVTVVVFLLMGLVFNFLNDQAAANDPQLSPLARPATQMPATTNGSPYFGSGPGPQLLIKEPAALEKQRAIEDELLGTYGWVDEKAGTARMPISEAKKLILQRGLPSRSDGAAPPTLGTRLPAAGESSGGRTIPTGRVKGQETRETPAAQPTHGVPPKGHGQ